MYDVTCDLCFAVVKSDLSRHKHWHQIHNLHGIDCAKLLTGIAQRNTDMYLTIPPCSCGLGIGE